MRENKSYMSVEISQHHRTILGWKGHLEIILSNHPAHVGSARTCCPGPCPFRSELSPQMEILKPLWPTCFHVWHAHINKVFLFSNGISCFNLCLLPVVLSVASSPPFPASPHVKDTLYLTLSELREQLLSMNNWKPLKKSTQTNL